MSSGDDDGGPVGEVPAGDDDDAAAGVPDHDDDDDDDDDAAAGVPDHDEERQLEDHVVDRVNAILERTADRTRFGSFGELQRHAASFLLSAWQVVTKRALPGVNRSPQTAAHHLANADVFLDALRRYSGVTLAGVDAMCICEGNCDVLLQCIEAIEFLLKKHRQQPPPAAHAAAAARSRSPVRPETLSRPEEQAKATWNRILGALCLPTVDTYQELRENICSVLTLAVEVLVDGRLANVARTPILHEHYVDNALISIEALSELVGERLGDTISAEALANGDPAAIQQCADVLSKVLQSGQHAAATPLADITQNSAGNVARPRPRTVGSRSADGSGRPKARAGARAGMTRRTPSTRTARSAAARLALPAKTQPSHVQYVGILSRQIASVGRKQELELERWRQRFLRASSHELHRDQAWKNRVQLDLQRNVARSQKIRDDTRTYTVAKVFKAALKLERDYLREQRASFNDRRAQLQAQWENKRTSIERFFQDKYDMLSQGIESDRSRRQIQERELRRQLRQLEKELRDERRRGLDQVRQRVLHDHRAAPPSVTPDQVLDRLLKLRV